jgi:hypothetical protein
MTDVWLTLDCLWTVPLLIRYYLTFAARGKIRLETRARAASKEEPVSRERKRRTRRRGEPYTHTPYDVLITK